MQTALEAPPQAGGTGRRPGRSAEDGLQQTATADHGWVIGPTASLDLVPAGGCERDTHRRGFA